MYMRSPLCPSPGIAPRTPTVNGWSEGLQTLIVAHSSREVRSLDRAGLELAFACAGAGARIARMPRSAAKAPRTIAIAGREARVTMR